MLRKFSAEMIGTFWLVFGGCGSAIFAFHAIGVLGVALAFGLTVMTMAYAIGPISGCHLNPAVTLGLWAGGRIHRDIVLPYIAAQIIGGVLAGAVLLSIASCKPDFDALAGFAASGYAEGSPSGYSLQAALAIEVLLAAFLLFVVMGATDIRTPSGFAPLAIGLTLVLIHLISLPITNTSVNPARSLGVAIFADPLFMHQLWLFWFGPLAGGVIGALTYRAVRPNAV